MIKKSWVVTALKTSLSGILLIYLIARTDVFKLASVLGTANILYLLIVLGVIIIGVVLSAYKWQILLRVHKINISLKRLVSFYFVGLFFNNFLPTSIGGDAVRIYDAARLSGYKVETAASVLIERMTGLLALLIIACSSLFFDFTLMKINPILPVFVIVFLGVYLLSIGILFNGKILKQFLFARILGIIGLEKFAERIHSSINLYRKSKHTLGRTVVISFIFQFMVILGNYLIAISLGMHIPLKYFFEFIPLIALLSMIPISLNGLGIREGGYVFFFTRVGLSSAEAFSIGLLSYALLLAASLTGGLIYMLRGKVA